MFYAFMEFHGYPPFGLSNVNEMSTTRSKVEELALDAHWESTIVHVLGHREGNHWVPGTIHTLNWDPVEVLNHEPLLSCHGKGGQIRGSCHIVLHVMRRQVRGSTNTTLYTLLG